VKKKLHKLKGKRKMDEPQTMSFRSSSSYDSNRLKWAKWIGWNLRGITPKGSLWRGK
jgi:hypothetical protein